MKKYILEITNPEESEEIGREETFIGALKKAKKEAIKRCDEVCVSYDGENSELMICFDPLGRKK